MKMFVVHFLLFFTSPTIEATARGRCVDSDGHKYRLGQGYEDKCTEFTCAEVGGNLQLVASPSPDCCWHAGSDYSTGDTVSSTWSPTQEEGCAETIVKCESVNGAATLVTDTIRGHYCVHNGEKLGVGERVALAQKCSWLVCNHHLINGVATPSLDLVVEHPGCDCCLDQAGAMHPHGTNVTSRKQFCNHGIWEDSTGFVLQNGSETYDLWLNPPTVPRLEVYAWSIQNPEQVAGGAKPVLEEVGPFVYTTVTIKDPTFNDDGETLTYRARNFYHLDRGQSVADPDTTFVTVPNIPYWTGIHNLKGESGFMWGIKAGVIATNGLGTPFINVSFTGLLWGYEDKLPCVGAGLPEPDECIKEREDPFEEDPYGDGDDWDYDRKKRDAEGQRDEMAEDDYIYEEKKFEKVIHMKEISEITGVKSEYLDALSAMDNSEFNEMFRPKAEWVNCSCLWGLFRDRNVTLRKPVTMYDGTNDLGKKGWLNQFDGKDTMGWWKEGSHCDRVGGQDGNTFPPNVYTEDTHMEIFLSSMCRKIKLDYEKKVDHRGIETLRFATTGKTLGSHQDPNPAKKNVENECFCMDGFSCFKSGVYDLGPCKVTPGRPYGTPIAVSLPHFYQADPSFGQAVDGMRPEKEKHEMYVDVVPELGVAMAMQYRFQLNAVLRREPNIAALANFPQETVVPFLWVQDGYSRPTREMVKKIKKDLAV